MISSDQATIVIVDDDAAFRRSLERLLSGYGFQVETYANAQSYLAREPGKGLACVLLDINMPAMTGTALQARLAELHQDIPIIFLTGFGDVTTSVKAMKGGAVDFLTKPVDEKVMLAAINEALARHRQIIGERSRVAQISRKIAGLTEREYQIMRYVIGGARNKQIASQLGISEKTVKAHRGQVMHKLAVTSVADLVRMCERVEIPLQKIDAME